MSSRREGVAIATAVAALTATATGLWAVAGPGFASPTPLPGLDSAPPWWVLAVLALVTERLAITVHGRRQTRAFTLGEATVILGLAFWGPGAMVLGRCAGTAASELLRRRPSGTKALVNVAMTAAESVVALTIHSWISGGVAFPELRAAGSLLVSALAANVVAALVLGLLLATLDRTPPWRMLGDAVTGDLPGAAAAASFGLTAAYVVHDEMTSLIVLAVCATTAGVLYRSHARLVADHRKLACLYRFNRVLSSCENSHDLTEQTLELSRVLLHAEYAEMLLSGSEPGQPITQVVSPLDGEVRWRSRLPEDLPAALVLAVAAAEPYTLVVGRHAWQAVARDPVIRAVLGQRLLVRMAEAVRARRPAYSDQAESYLESLGLEDGVSVPLVVEDRHLGCLIVAGRMGRALGFDSADIDLLTTMATQAAMALHRTELIDRVQWEATHDTLTGLPNRLMFNRATQEALEARRPEAKDTLLGVAVVDLDRFHDVNDTFGHEIADVLLREVASRLATAAGDDALVARLGSDEFGVLVAASPTREHLVGLLERIAAALEDPITAAETSMSFSASVGLAFVADTDTDADVTSLVVQADVALQAAKSSGRPLVTYSPDIDNRAPHRLAIAADLRGALREGDLTVHVQPQVDLATRVLVGVEALVRWHHPTRGLVFPDEFIPVAETTGLVGELTHVVLEKSLAAVASWRRKGLHVPIAVNLSARSLVDPDLVSSVQRALRRYRLPAAMLTLEITESSVMADPQRAIRTLARLRDLGITLAVDDFGTGYSSLSYLTRLPVQEVKVDKSFVMTLCENAENASIVRSIVDLGANLGLKVIAEGVEDARSWDLLRQMGCDVAQGYYLARPMPAEDLAGWLEANPLVQRPVVSVA